jgi:tetrapyrrole methylase family protein/MazG family protein
LVEDSVTAPIDELLAVMDRLRGPQGCPWDREQTLKTLQTYLLEEAHEVLQAMECEAPEPLREELGDLLFQVVFQSRIAAEKGWFDFQAIARGISEKLVRRHPHVFGDARVADSREVIRQWEDLKEEERRKSTQASRLGGVPPSLPALLQALRLSEKAARAGFDWTSAEQVFHKVREEIGEWEEATHAKDSDSVARELGDLLFSLVNVARKLGLDPEASLQGANQRFRGRFATMEKTVMDGGERMEELSPRRWEELWARAKSEKAT